jgi:hypothetical protein
LELSWNAWGLMLHDHVGVLSMGPIRASILAASLCFSFATCAETPHRAVAAAGADVGPQATPQPSPERSRRQPTVEATGKIIHVVVALCDNKYQGIVPVPERIGNGDDPASNLYWGAGFGVESSFSKAKDWRRIALIDNRKPGVLQTAVFQLRSGKVLLIADAYRGREIKQCTADFLRFAAGLSPETLGVQTDSGLLSITCGGGANLIAYVGHDGLMDFQLEQYPSNSGGPRKDAIILACASKAYFQEPLHRTGARPILWTTNLMAPEAYSLKAAIDGWILNESGQQIRSRAAEAYNKYQHCGQRAALNLFATDY